MSARRFEIVVAERLGEAAMARLASVGEVRVLGRCEEADLVTAVAEADALVIRSFARVTRAVIEAGRRLRVVGRAGVGLEQVDSEAARERGVRVVYTPAASTDSVAELAVGLMLAVERRLVRADAMVRGAAFAQARGELIGRELRGLTLGVVGMGRIGSAVARICHDGLGMSIVYNDVREVGPFAFEARCAAKEELYACADVVSLHVPLTPETRGLIGGRALRLFRPTATLINTARGAVVEAGALAEALREGRLAGAGLDVHEPEPPGADYPMMGMENVVLSAHQGARTRGALARMDEVVEDVIAVLEGREPEFAA